MPERSAVQLSPRARRRKALAQFSRRLALMLRAELPLLQALAILEELTEDRVLSKALAGVREAMKETTSLSTALAKQPTVFSPAYVGLCAAGEASGNLDEVLFQLAERLQKEASHRKKVIAFLAYPSVAVGLGVAGLLALATAKTALDIPASDVLRPVSFALAAVGVVILLSHAAIRLALGGWRRPPTPTFPSAREGGRADRRLRWFHYPRARVENGQTQLRPATSGVDPQAGEGLTPESERREGHAPDIDRVALAREFSRLVEEDEGSEDVGA